jgi:Mrp family chromosome partitioning ATPase
MQVMQELAQRADMVIYDAPPAGVVTDPTILATRVDAVLLVINAGTTRRDIILRVRQNLEKVGAKLVMPVLNRVSLRDLQGYYYYYHYQNYGSETKEEASSAGGPHLNGKVPLSATDDPVATHAADGQGDKNE